MNYTVAGIHTGIGKTICSTILCEALRADYWKPVQAGDLDKSDSIFVQSHSQTIVHPERYKLTTPASPHYAAAIDGLEIQLKDFILPSTKNNLIVETAGGIMSPLSHSVLNIHLMQHIGYPVILVSENYLGSINHTLLSIELLKKSGINLIGIVFNGEKNDATESFITSYSGITSLFSIPRFDSLNKESIEVFAGKIRSSLLEKLA